MSRLPHGDRVIGVSIPRESQAEAVLLFMTHSWTSHSSHWIGLRQSQSSSQGQGEEIEIPTLRKGVAKSHCKNL